MDAACLALAPVHTGAASTEMSMRRGKRAGAGAEQLRDTMELSFPHVTLWGKVPFLLPELGQGTAE